MRVVSLQCVSREERRENGEGRTCLVLVLSLGAGGPHVEVRYREFGIVDERDGRWGPAYV